MVSLWTQDVRTVARRCHGRPHGHGERVWGLRGGKLQQRAEARSLHTGVLKQKPNFLNCSTGLSTDS